MNSLDTALEEKRAAAFVAIGSSADADIRYLTRFRATDPFVYVKKKTEQGIIVVSSMEYERAKRQSMARVMSRNEARYFDFLKEDPDHRTRATARMIAALAGESILVPPQFPYDLGKELELFCMVTVERDAVSRMRALKTPDEMDHIRRVQRSTESAMKRVLVMLKNSRPNGDVLWYRDSALTSERIKTIIQRHLIERGCLAQDTIVSCGQDTALPHLTGKGPLRPNEPIVIDIFPQDEESGYFADMTRTVVKGEPTGEILDMYAAVLEAQTRAASRIKAGVTGAELQQETVDFFKERGYESNARGFMHNLGHGVGLDVHEAPVLGSGGGALSAGNVVTIEPGLYYPEYGGVRLEDMGAVTSEGFERFTRCKEVLIL